MEMKKIIKETILQYLNEQNETDKIPKPSKSFLYHGTNIKNLNDIKRFGLIPDFGDTVKSTEAYQYYMDDNYINPEYRVDGVIFFSDEPNTWSYSHFGKTPDINDAALVIVKKNDTIFRKLGEHFYDSNGKKVDSINYIPIDKLPFFIENKDYFSFEEQEVFDILHGKRLVNYLSQFL